MMSDDEDNDAITGLYLPEYDKGNHKGIDRCSNSSRLDFVIMKESEKARRG